MLMPSATKNVVKKPVTTSMEQGISWEALWQQIPGIL